MVSRQTPLCRLVTCLPKRCDTEIHEQESVEAFCASEALDAAKSGHPETLGT